MRRRSGADCRLVTGTGPVPFSRGLPFSGVLKVTLRVASMTDQPGPGSERPYNLLRRFAALSLVCIVATSASSAFLLARFLKARMLEREAVVTMEFIESIVHAEATWSSFINRTSRQADPVLESFFNHIANLPDVVRANVYAQDRTVLWSSTPGFIGRVLGPNHELDEAFAGELAIESGTVGVQDKAEHIAFRPDPGTRFVEAYIPIWSRDHARVCGVVEIYKLPHALFAAIDAGRRLVWLGAAASAVLLYAVLFWIVRRASRTIACQHQRLTEAETIATIGEMATAVAHGIRNPLASIRSSAELAAGEDLDEVHAATADIVREADRLDGWVRDLLLFARAEAVAQESVDVNDTLRTTLQGAQPAIGRKGVRLAVALDEPLPRIRGKTAPLTHAFDSLITNALDAMPEGGSLRIESRLCREHGQVEVSIADTGPGVPRELLGKVMRPFFTTKRTGVGLGLSLARRIIGRCGGSFDIKSVEGQGTVVAMRFPPAA